MSAERATDRAAVKRINRAGKCKPGEPIPAGQAPAKPGRYDVRVNLTVKKVATVPPSDTDPSPPPVIPGPHPDPLPPPPDWNNVIEDQVFRGGTGGNGNPFMSLRGKKNVLIRRTKFTDAERCVLKGPQGDGAIFYDCEVSELRKPTGGGGGEHGTMAFYPGENWQTSDDDYGLLFSGVDFRNNTLSDDFEIKSSHVAIIGCTGKFTVRIRHGVGSLVYNCPECWNVTTRCGPHLISDCPDCRVILYSGNLFGKLGSWEPGSGGTDGAVHEPQGGHNMQCSYQVSVARVKSVTVGFAFNDKQKKFPATDCIVDPGMSDEDVKVIQAVRLRRDQPVPRPDLSAFRMQQAVKAQLQRIRAKTEESWARASVDDRGREMETGLWFAECYEGAAKAGGIALRGE
jgi:hypothetical protein